MWQPVPVAWHIRKQLPNDSELGNNLKVHLFGKFLWIINAMYILKPIVSHYLLKQEKTFTIKAIHKKRSDWLYLLQHQIFLITRGRALQRHVLFIFFHSVSKVLSSVLTALYCKSDGMQYQENFLMKKSTYIYNFSK